MTTYGTTPTNGSVGSTGSLGIAERDAPPTDLREPDAGDRVREVSSDAKDHVKDLVGTAADEARSVADEVKAHARDLMGETKGVVTEQVDTQVSRLASSLEDYARQLVAMAARADNPGDPLPELMRSAGDRMQSFAHRIEQRGPNGMLEDVKRFARRRPGVFIFGAVGAGFVAGRLLRNVDRQALSDAATGKGNGVGAQESLDFDIAAGAGIGASGTTTFGSPSSSSTLPGAAPASAPAFGEGGAMSSPATPSSGGVVDLTGTQPTDTFPTAGA